jgi:hypothetical protein
MHYLTYVFIGKDTDINQAVTEAMRPFGDEFPVPPWKKYLCRQEIAVMARCYKLRRTALHKLAARMEDWNGGNGGVDRRGLYAVLRWNPHAKWDRYELGGRWNGWLKNNAITAGTLQRSPKLKALLPHDFLTPDGQWHAVEKYVSTGWLKGCFVRKSVHRWLQEFTRGLTAWPHHRVVCVDRHN